MLEKRSIKSIKRLIKQLEINSWHGLTNDEAFELCKMIYEGLHSPTFKMLRDPKRAELTEYGLWRARKLTTSDEALHESSFWEPPLEFVKGPGRCNRAGESMLYVSNHLSTCVVESGAKKGEKWFLAEFDLRPGKSLNFICLGIRKNLLLKHCLNSEELENLRPIFEEKKNRILDDSIQYAYQIPKIKDPSYKKSIAVTEYFLKSDQGKVGLDCIYYPSIASEVKGVNIAIKPSSARKNIELKNILQVLVENVDLARGKIDIQFLNIGRNHGGKIIWDNEVVL